MNNEFKQTLQQIVDLPIDKKVSLALESVQGLAPELSEKFDKDKILGLIMAIFSTAAAADGKLAREEFALIKAFLQALGIEMSDEQIVKMIADFADKDTYAAVHAINKTLSPQGKANLISLVAAVCAIDDRIDPNELAYLDDLYNG